MAAREALKAADHKYLQRRLQRQKLTASQRFEVARRYREGEKAKDIAVEFGITAAYVYNLGSRG